MFIQKGPRMQCVWYVYYIQLKNSFLPFKTFTTQKKFWKQIWPLAIIQNLLYFQRKQSYQAVYARDYTRESKNRFSEDSIAAGKWLSAVIFSSRDFPYSIHERQFDTTGEECSLRSELNADGSSGDDLLVLRFTQEVSCIGLEQRNASFLTRVGFSLDNVESWFGVLSLSWEESVDSFVSVSDSSLSGVSSLGILLAGAPCSASSKCTTMTLVLSARSSLSRHLDNARWINLLRKFEIISN